MSCGSSEALSPASAGSPEDNGNSLVKSWALPPRPKPGRKPATDTPPSKRKQQNREAQRAFRERRAARVGELEEEIRQIQAQFDKERQESKAKFEHERQDFRQEIATWRVRCEHWERQHNEKQAEVEGLKKHQVDMETNLRMRWSSGSQTSYDSGTSSKSWSQSQLSPTSLVGPPLNSILPFPKVDSTRPTAPVTPAADCRSCGTRGHCACVESILNSLPDPRQDPLPSPELHKPSESEIRDENGDLMEIDFTSKQPQALTSSKYRSGDSHSEPIAVDAEEDTSAPSAGMDMTDCGFCTDDKNCLCRAGSQAWPLTPKSANQPHKPRQTSKPEPMEPASSAQGPGSCSDCLADPERRRFCQALAGVSQRSSQSSSRPNNMRQKSPRDAGMFPSISERMTCSDAYNVLKQQMPDFAQRRESTSLMKQLHAVPHEDKGHSRGMGSPSLDVEAAGVLSVLSQSSGGSYSDGARRKAQTQSR